MSDNPYLVVLGKRLRNLRKRSQKISDFEKLKIEGKDLNAEQLEAVASKAFVERAVADMESLVEQLTAVAKEHGWENPAPAAAPVSVPASKEDDPVPPLTEEDLVAAAKQFADMGLQPAKEDKDKAEKEKKKKKEKERVSVGVSTQMFQTPPAKEEATAASAATAADIKAEVALQLKKLLRALHVSARYASQTGKALPAELDYFGSMALGQVMLGAGADFATNLNQSFRHVGFFLYVRDLLVLLLLSLPPPSLALCVCLAVSVLLLLLLLSVVPVTVPAWSSLSTRPPPRAVPLVGGPPNCGSFFRASGVGDSFKHGPQ